MSNRSWLLGLCVASFLPLAAAENGRDIFVQMGIEESFIVHLKPNWQVFRRKAVDLCFEDFLIRGADNSFNLSMQFCYEDPDLLQYDTPEKQRKALLELTASLYDESYEKACGLPPPIRDFAPGGRSGCALRLTARRWVGKTPPPEEPEGKFVTCGLFRVGANSALFFQLWSNRVDDAEYRELVDMIVKLTIPERGEPGWKLFDGMKAAEVAGAEFPRHFSADELAARLPYTVRRTASGWHVRGSRWDGAASGGTVEMELDGATGKVLRVYRGK